MESKKINQLATELAPDLSDLTIIGDPTTGISKKITLSQMASLFTGTVEEYANLAAFPLVGVADTIYIALDTNVIYRWDSTSYVVLSPNIIASLVFNDANGFDGTIALVGSVATLTITTALTSGSVPFIGASGALTQDNANLFFDDTNNRLGINTNAPTTALDVFGSGIIGRINGTSTNNAYLGFSSAGTNKWSVGNVQSDHRFRIFSEANSAELVSVLQTGEFGIGIANPTTKLHIDGGASALIANLDANVSVAKSVSFRSDNSNRFNIEVSGTESGSNAGADLFIRRYSDAGSLIDTPLTITRSTGNATFSGILITPQVKAATSAGLSINANSGTQVADFGAGGSANITFFGGLSGTSATFSSTITAAALSRIGDLFIGGRSGTYVSYPDGIFGDNLHLGATGTGGSVFINALLSRSLIINPLGGNVSIGNSSASYTLDISGSLRNTTSAYFATTSGNVGIGISATNTWRSDVGNVRALEFDAGSMWGFRTTGTGEINIAQNFYYGASGTRFRIQTGAATNYRQDNGEHTFQYIASDTAGTSFTFNDALKITNTGNVGIGTNTPTVYGTKNLEVNGSGSAYITVKGSSNAVIGELVADGDVYLSSKTANALILRTNDGERMRITAAGNVGIGTVSPTRLLDVNGVIRTQNAGSAGAPSIELGTSAQGNGLFNPTTNTIAISTNDTERMRITSGGNILINATSGTTQGEKFFVTANDLAGMFKTTGGAANQWAANFWNNATSGNNLFIEFATETSFTGRGSVTYNRGAGLVVFNTTSDYRIKTEIEDFDALSIIKNLKPKEFRIYDSPQKSIGFIAHELQEYYPQAVSGEKDAINKDGKPLYQGVDYSQLTGLLTKAIQELKAEIDELKTKIK
jgi:hypothetical protein